MLMIEAAEAHLANTGECGKCGGLESEDFSKCPLDGYCIAPRYAERFRAHGGYYNAKGEAMFSGDGSPHPNEEPPEKKRKLFRRRGNTSWVYEVRMMDKDNICYLVVDAPRRDGFGGHEIMSREEFNDDYHFLTATETKAARAEIRRKADSNGWN